MFRRIAVHVDPGVDCPRRIEFCLRIAKAHDAHLTGIFASYMSPGNSFDEGGLWARSSERVIEIDTKSCATLQTAFCDAAGRAGVAASWRQGEGWPARCVSRHARYSDALIIGQDNAYDLKAATGSDFVEQTLLFVGRPVIVLPNAGTFETLGTRVLYCWNGGREAARAIADAAPLLRKAGSLRVLTMDGDAGPKAEVEALFEDLAAYCACHGFPQAEHEIRSTRDTDVGDAILSAAADFGADLIVMGAYGHSRMHQLVMGGATRALLNAMTVPVLFSH